MRPDAIWLSIALAAASPAAPAFAQTPVQPIAAAEFDRMVDALRESSMTAEEIRTTDAFERLDIVELEGLAPAQAETLEEVLRNTEDGYAEVQTAIVTNVLFTRQVELRSLDISRIFAATRNEDDVVTIYLR